MLSQETYRDILIYWLYSQYLCAYRSFDKRISDKSMMYYRNKIYKVKGVTWRMIAIDWGNSWSDGYQVFEYLEIDWKLLNQYAKMDCIRSD